MKFRRILLFTIVLFMICFTLRVKVAKGETAFILQSPWLNVTSGMILPDDGFIGLTAESETDCALVLGTKGKAVDMLTTHTFSATALSAGDNNNKKLALGSLDGSIILRNASEVLALKKITNDHYLQLPPEKPVTAVAFSPDEQTLASGTEDGTIAVWDTESRELLFLLSGIQKNDVTTVSFSPDGMYLASGAMDGSVILWNLWNVPKPREVLSLNRHNGSVNTIAFSPNSQTLATGAEDKLINLWKIPEKSEPTVLEGHAGAVKAISFSPDGIHLASGGSFGEVLLWDIPNNTKIEPRTRYFKVTTLEIKERAHEKDIVAITFSENGNKLISICQEKHAEWSLKEIKINPEPSELFFAEKPKPLIEKRREQDEIAPIVDNVVYEDEVDSETAGTIVSGRVTDLNEIRSFTVNGENVKISENGEFETSVNLEVGKNEIPIVAIDSNDNRNDEIILSINRKPKPDTELPVITIEGIAVGEQRDVEPSVDTFLVKGKATDDSGINTVKVNNEDVYESKETETEKIVEFNRPVSLQVGNNPITIIAIDNHGNKSEKKLTINRLSQRPIVQPIDINGVKSEPNRKQTNGDYKIQILSPIKDEDNIIKSADNPIFVLFKVFPSNNIDVNVQIRYADRNLDFPCVVEHQGGELFRATITLTTDQSTMKINVESEGQTVATEQYTIIRQSNKTLPFDPLPTDRLKPIKIVSLRIQNVKLDESKSDSKGIRETEPDGEKEPPGIEVHFSDSGDIPKIAVTTSSISGQIDIFGKTEGPGGGTIKYSINNDNRIIVNEYGKYGTEEHEFQLTREQNQQVVLDYGENTLTFYAVPPEGNQADHKRELIINRVHEREGKDYALLIAVEDYSDPRKSSDASIDNAEWDPLDAPIDDAEALKEILESEYGFEIYPKGEVVQNPTKSEINQILRHLAKVDFPNEDDQLIIFLAGHGYAQKLNDETFMGYFLPKPEEKSIPKPNSEDEARKFEKQEDDLIELSISHLELRYKIDGIKCQNILVIMDTCYSGVFSNEVVGERGFQRPLKDKGIQDKLTKRTRQYLTSGSIETVLDKQPGEKHSPFALQLLKALKEGDENKDSIVTFNELQGYFLPSEFSKSTKSNQTPRAGTFSDNHELGSEFLLWKRKP